MNIEFEKRMLMKFLKRFFPVSRIKYNGRFRRAIIFDDGKTYIYSDTKAMYSLRFKLVDELKQTFLIEDTICLVIVDNFLQLNDI